MNEQRFDKWLQEALDTDVRPSDDFTARVMDRVAATPQEKPRTNNIDKRKLKRMMTALAACAAIVILIPVGLLMMPKGSAAPAADGAAQESLVMDEGADMGHFADDAARTESDTAIDDGMFYTTNGSEEGYAAGGEAAPQSEGEEQEKTISGTVLRFDGDEAKLVQQTLAELGIEPDSTAGAVQHYVLTEEDTVKLHELLPELIDAEGTLELTLEVAE